MLTTNFGTGSHMVWGAPTHYHPYHQTTATAQDDGWRTDHPVNQRTENWARIVELTWRRQCTIAFSTNHNNKMEVNACLCINLILSTMFRFTTPYLRSNQLCSVGFLVGFLAGGKLLSSLQSSKPRHSRQLSEDNVPHSNQQGGSSHVKYFRIL